MFGISEKEAREIARKEAQEAVATLQRNIDSRFRTIKAPPTSGELAQQALQQLISMIDPREFLDNLLITKGLTLEAMIRQIVKKELEEGDYTPTKDEVLEQAVDQVAEWIHEGLDEDEVKAAIGEKVLNRLLKEKEGER